MLANIKPVQSTAQECYLWPCNVPAWHAWTQVQTQWHMGGMGTPTALNWADVRVWLDEHGYQAGQERTDIFDGITAAARATLDVWAEKAARDKQQQQ